MNMIRPAIFVTILLAAPLAVGGTLLPDGSFEQGPPPSSGWSETADQACERIGDHSGFWYVSSYDGLQDFWAAGYCMDEGSGVNLPMSNSVSQTVVVPVDGAMLSFVTLALRLSDDDAPADGDRAYVAINGAEVWSMPLTAENNSYPDWTGPVYVDLAAYAGQSVTLTLGGVTVGAETGNLRFDFVSFVDPATPDQGVSWGAVKALYR
jgi:hypothetical protein